MLDVGGQDATEAFEDVGHSDEAREILEGLVVGKLNRAVRAISGWAFLRSTSISKFSLQPYLICIRSYSIPPFLPLIIKTIVLPSTDLLSLTSTLAPQPGDPPRTQPPPTKKTSTPSQNSAGLGVGLYALVFVGAALAFGAYKYLQTSASGQDAK